VGVLIAITGMSVAAVAIVVALLPIYHRDSVLIVAGFALLFAIFGAVWRVGDVLQSRFNRS